MTKKLNRIHPTKLIAEKVDFIKSNFPEYKNVDPYLDYYFVERVKKAMIEKKLYRHAYACSNPNVNSSIINLIRRAKGDVITNRRKVN